MPLARKYDTFEIRTLMKSCEGKPSPLTGAAAHARGLHAAPGSSMGAAPFAASMHNRTHKMIGESNNQFKNRGGTARTSAFNNLLNQSEAVTHALNSPKGQDALRAADAHPAAARRLFLEVSGVKEASYLSGTSAPAAQTVHKNDASVSGISGDGVRIIIDLAPNTTELFVQTCFPLSSCLASKFELSDFAAGHGAPPLAAG